MGVSISVATGLYGVSFGALAVASGLTVAQACALSLLLFSGGSQFAFIGVVAGGGSGMAAVSAASLLGVRNAIYGMQMSRLLGVKGLHDVRRKVEFKARRSILPPDLFNKYQDMDFWQDQTGTSAGIIAARRSETQAPLITKATP